MGFPLGVKCNNIVCENGRARTLQRSFVVIPCIVLSNTILKLLGLAEISRILSFGPVIPMMIAGIVVWVKQKTPHLFLSGFFMFAFSALGPATGNSDLIFFISMFGELLMVLFLYLYCRRKQAEQISSIFKPRFQLETRFSYSYLLLLLRAFFFFSSISILRSVL